MNGLSEVRKDARIGKARAAAAQIEETLGKRVREAVKAPSTPFDIALHAEIRAVIRETGQAAVFIDEHVGDERVLTAVLTAPAFLSGLSDVEFNLLKSREESRLNPEAAATVADVAKALEQIKHGLVIAEKMIGERGQLMKTADGWAPRPPRGLTEHRHGADRARHRHRQLAGLRRRPRLRPAHRTAAGCRAPPRDSHVSETPIATLRRSKGRPVRYSPSPLDRGDAGANMLSSQVR